MSRALIRRTGVFCVSLPTAHTDAQTIQRLYMAGADDYISKPIVAAELIMRVQNRLERARLYRHRMEVTVTALFAGQRFEQSSSVRSVRSTFRSSVSRRSMRRPFPDINDRYQPEAGDTALRRLGQMLAKFFRPQDVARVWGR